MKMASLESSASLSNLAEPLTADVDDSTEGHAELAQDGSPRRRSTRVSAMRAAERMKGENIEETSEGVLKRYNAEDGNAGNVKKRKMARFCGLDQTDAHFAVQLDSDDDAVVLSDDSVVSSINDNEANVIRKTYEKATSKELTAEQRLERQLMIKQLESELRLEEARLLMLKKLRMSQQMPAARDTKPAANTNAQNLTSSRTNQNTTNFRPQITTQPAGARINTQPPVKPTMPTQNSRSGNVPAAHQASTKGMSSAHNSNSNLQAQALIRTAATTNQRTGSNFV